MKQVLVAMEEFDNVGSLMLMRETMLLMLLLQRAEVWKWMNFGAVPRFRTVILSDAQSFLV